MAMLAVQRRWTAREVRELIEKNPLATPRYELVDGELLVTPSPSAPQRWQPNDARPDILPRELVWHPAAASEPFRLDLLWCFAEILGD